MISPPFFWLGTREKLVCPETKVILNPAWPEERTASIVGKLQIEFIDHQFPDWILLHDAPEFPTNRSQSDHIDQMQMLENGIVDFERKTFHFHHFRFTLDQFKSLLLIEKSLGTSKEPKKVNNGLAQKRECSDEESFGFGAKL